MLLTLTRILALAVLLTPLGLSARTQAQAAGADLSGKWKLVVSLPFNDLELVLAEVKKGDAAYTGKILASGFPAGLLNFDKVQLDGDTVTLLVKGGPIADPFVGALGKDNKALGTIKIQNTVYPARLEKTDADTVSRGDPQANAAARTKYITARRERDPKAKLATLQEILKEDKGIGTAGQVYPEALEAAAAAGLGEGQVRELVDAYLAAAKPYGAAYLGEARVKAASALSDAKNYATIAIDLAQTADKELPETASTEQKVAVVTALASAAKLAGNTDLASAAQGRLDKLNAMLDKEYEEKVPPFKPATFEGRKTQDANRLVLMELFTGAECPPCVAADVAFDGLIRTYKPTDVVLLQYHLHIPGPDPLTNADTVARARYYPDLRGTPSTFFDGKSQAGGGGGMANAEAKYGQYREIIDPALETKAGATIDLQARRDGDAIKVTASAKADSKSDQLRLRLALVEDSIRYTGGNGLRFHHKVVRAMPGGVEGQTLTGGAGKVDTVVDLAQVRKGLEAYLAEFQNTSGSFPHPLPPIDLKGLSIVAFVQDDATKNVLQAAIVPLDAAAH
jgi:hypothetical protein